MNAPLSQAEALEYVRRECDANHVELVMPDDPRRMAAVLAFALGHALAGDGWDFEYARTQLALTLPGAGAAADLLRHVPVVGPHLAPVLDKVRGTVFMPPPAAFAAPNGHLLIELYKHEEGHMGEIAVGGLPWCLCYGIFDDVRAGSEGPCYGASMAAAIGLLERAETDAARRLARPGRVDAAEHAALVHLDRYGLRGDALALARSLLHANADTLRRHGDPGGVIAELRASLPA